MEKDFYCTTCPSECHLHVTLNEGKEFDSVRGNRCARGEAFARQEILRPVRVLTSTVLLKNGGLLPVRSRQPFPLDLHRQAMGQLRACCLEGPLHMGDVVLANIAASGVDMIASCDA